MQRSPSITLSDAVFPRSGLLQNSLVRDILLIIGFSLFTALCAQISIRLPFTPVPITGQTFAALLTGAVLGSRKGALSMLTYAFEGSVGLPVFAGGRAGPIWGLSSGGYIVGFVFAAFIVGLLAERGWDRRPWVTVAMLLGNVVIYLFGLPWLGYFIANNILGLYDVIPGDGVLNKTLIGGLWPFIPGDLTKLYLASIALPSAWALVGRFQK